MNSYLKSFLLFVFHVLLHIESNAPPRTNLPDSNLRKTYSTEDGATSYGSLATKKHVRRIDDCDDEEISSVGSRNAQRIYDSDDEEVPSVASRNAQSIYDSDENSPRVCPIFSIS